VLPPVNCNIVGDCVGPWMLLCGIDYCLMRTRIEVFICSEIAIVNL
jgi:hypothetical protein